MFQIFRKQKIHWNAYTINTILQFEFLLTSGHLHARHLKWKGYAWNITHALFLRILVIVFQGGLLANVESWNQSRWGWWVVGRGRNPRANTAECKEHTHTYTQERTKVHGHGPAKDSLVVFLKLNSSSRRGSHRKDQTLLPKKFLPTFERARAANIWGNGSLLSSLSDIKATHTQKLLQSITIFVISPKHVWESNTWVKSMHEVGIRVLGNNPLG